jgi:beta-N-acetylhexosaminidase
VCFEASHLTPDLPPWVSVDQEGGRVARLKTPFTEWPPMATLGRSGDARLAERFARALAAELKAVGFTLDYAPVLDVQTNPKNPVIGDRALADNAADVARLGARSSARCRQKGSPRAETLSRPRRHDADSHHELPLVEHPPERSREVEFVPFKAPRRRRRAIMTAHVFVPALDDARPATLSRRIVSDLLRASCVRWRDSQRRSRDEGDRVSVRRTAAAVMAIEAGCDGALICSGDHDTQAAALEALVHAVERNACRCRASRTP